MGPGQDDIRGVERRAAARAARSPSGIGVVIAARQPGRSVRCRVSDGTLFGWVDVAVTADDTSDLGLEQHVERFAQTLPERERLERLEAAGPLRYPGA